MGKYMRKSEATVGGGVALMEASHTPASLGVRTRARVALERLQNSGAAAAAEAGAGAAADGGGGSYLQLRSRRLQKITPPIGRRSRRGSSRLKVKKVKEAAEENSPADLGVDEAFFGENVLELEGIERNTRETTPCQPIRISDSILRTPGSSTRPAITTEANNRENSISRNIPTPHGMEEYFRRAEEQQQKEFMEKYNFDPVNEKPLPGRFEWEKVSP